MSLGAVEQIPACQDLPLERDEICLSMLNAEQLLFFGKNEFRIPK